MTPIFLYIFKMAIASAILLGYYWFALRNERFHQWNRFYLLAAMALSIIVPFLQIPLPAANETQTVATVVAAMPWNGEAQINTVTNEATEGIPVLWMCAALVSLVLLFRLLTAFLRIGMLYKKHKSLSFGVIKLIYTEERSAPFSFFKWLFWRIDIDPVSENGERMLQHELAHINQKHSADKLFIELVLLVFWCNPIFWLIKKELSAIHEFLADEKAIQGADGAAFATMILTAAHAGHTPEIANPFFSSHLKRRLIMITTSRTPKYSYTRRICGLVLTAGLALFMAFTVQQATAKDKENTPGTSENYNLRIIVTGYAKLTDADKAFLAVQKNPELANALVYYGGVEITRQQFSNLSPTDVSKVEVIKGEDAVKAYGEKGQHGVIKLTAAPNISSIAPFVAKASGSNPSPTFPGGVAAWRKYLERNFRYPEAAQNSRGQGLVKVDFEVDKAGNVSNIKVVSSPNDSLSAEVERILKASPKWTPAMSDEKAVASSVNTEVLFQLQ